jgi:hypothetical protein
MNIPYPIEVYDDVVDKALQTKVWDYLQKQIWHQKWVPKEEQRVLYYRPEEDGLKWMLPKAMHMSSTLHRCVLASDEDSLKKLHLPIYILWQQINRALGNKYRLTGIPEGMHDHETAIPETTDPDLTPGWRAYVNAKHNLQIDGDGYPHRDCPFLDQDSYVTMLYVVNTEWYPSWGGELKFYPDDPEGITGDHQQFNSRGQQERGFNIGWLDKGRIVSPVPNRLVVYDGRCLHTSLATNNQKFTPLMRVAFRAQRIADTN